MANANVVHEAFASEPRPGMTGWEATLAIAKKLEGVDFLPSLYSHPIGYHGHALGPSINARNMDTSTLPGRDSILRAGSYRSVEFSATTAVPEYGGGTVTIPMEDDAYLTTDGYIYFRPYQTEWYVIR
jgi:Xaa-Pro aminopeptidase